MTQKYTFTHQNGKKEEVDLCNKYYANLKSSKVLGILITVVILIVNTILKLSIVLLVKWVGEDTQSKQLTSITNGVFYAQFFNTGLLLTLVNANMTEHKPGFLTQFFNSGDFYDYFPLWYSNVGKTIVQTMFINSIKPYIELAVTSNLPKVLRMMDNSNPYKTKKTSIAQFKKLWYGGTYLIHAK